MQITTNLITLHRVEDTEVKGFDVRWRWLIGKHQLQPRVKMRDIALELNTTHFTPLCIGKFCFAIVKKLRESFHNTHTRFDERFQVIEIGACLWSTQLALAASSLYYRGEKTVKAVETIENKRAMEYNYARR